MTGPPATATHSKGSTQPELQALAQSQEESQTLLSRMG